MHGQVCIVQPKSTADDAVSCSILSRRSEVVSVVNDTAPDNCYLKSAERRSRRCDKNELALKTEIMQKWVFSRSYCCMQYDWLSQQQL